ncbi:uncharacterized protein HKW66_Vig0111700 [Vigna angularis]|uniref:Uncharacterized protein n=2 Tax=Phaseolus angularis TaxID=3914 RepID=A0A8T0KZD6_PHAAN|nr:uncharacterized protein HKW66_Vig0111700 [Vigna angularis]
MLGTTVLIPSSLVPQMGGENVRTCWMLFSFLSFKISFLKLFYISPQEFLFPKHMLLQLKSKTTGRYFSHIPYLFQFHTLLYTFVPTTISIILAGRYSDIVCNCKHHNHNNVFNCKHSPSATLDLLILLLVLFSGAFLLSSYFSYIFHSLSLLLPSLPLSYLLPFFLFFALSLAATDFCCGPRSRRCQRSGCKGLKKAMEFDLQIHRFGSAPSPDASAEIDCLPWKGGTEANHDYECLRSELRKMAPPVVD